jgi:metal-responsive CopG/Arc/MetJ family transcriptional regulator
MKRHSVRKHRKTSTSARRIAVDLPEPLFNRAESATRDLSINRSELVRQAVERFLEELQRAKLEKELAEGYAANAELDRAIGEEFAAVDYEGF